MNKITDRCMPLVEKQVSRSRWTVLVPVFKSRQDVSTHTLALVDAHVLERIRLMASTIGQLGLSFMVVGRSGHSGKESVLVAKFLFFIGRHLRQ